MSFWGLVPWAYRNPLIRLCSCYRSFFLSCDWQEVGSQQVHWQRDMLAGCSRTSFLLVVVEGKLRPSAGRGLPTTLGPHSSYTVKNQNTHICGVCTKKVMRGRIVHKEEARPGSSLGRGHLHWDVAGEGKPQVDNLCESLSMDYIKSFTEPVGCRR